MTNMPAACKEFVPDACGSCSFTAFNGCLPATYHTACPLPHTPLKSLNLNDAADVLEQLGHQSCLAQDRLVFASLLQETKDD